MKKTKVKVTFCTREDTNLSGGQNTWLSRFLPELRRLGIASRVLYFSSSREELPTIHSLREAGIDCKISCDEDKRYTEQRVRWILEQLAANPPDAFVSNMVLPEAYYAARYAKKAGIATIGVCHIGVDHFLYRGLLDQFVFGGPAHQVSALIPVSNYVERDILKRNPKGIVVRSIHCGVSIPRDVAKPPTDRLRLAYVGRLSEEAKCISEVTRTLCRAVREVPDIEAFIYGDGEERAVVERIIRTEADSLPVHLVGPVEHEQISKVLLNCHAVVLLSDWEGLGLALLEGMACGLVPIGLRRAHGGGPEIIEDGVTGLLVDNRSDSFVAAVRRLRQDSKLWRQLARSARATAEAEYSIERCATRWRQLFDELSNSARQRKALRIPKVFDFPAVHPALAVLDERAPRPHEQLLRKAWHLMNRVLR